MPFSNPDVLLLGAGPVGLTAACELLRHGISVRLIERRVHPVEHSHALVVHVRTQEILKAMGAISGFTAQGYRLPGIIAHVDGKRIGQIDLAGADSPYPGPLVLGQNHTERLLAKHLRSLGGQIERGVEASAFEQDAQSVRVRLRHLGGGSLGHEETAVASWLVDCEGTRSMVRDTLGIPFEGQRYAGEEFLMADARVHWIRCNGYAYLFYTAERLVAFFPFDDAGFYRVLCMRRDTNPTNQEPPTLEEMESIAREHADPSLTLSASTWLTRFRTGYRIAGRFREGRAFLAGDAAHAHSPIGGQGMNYGMHDAFNLAWKLAAVIKGYARPGLLETYDTERRPVDAAMVQNTDHAFQALSRSHPWAAAAVRVLGPLMLKLPVLQHRIRDTVGELNVAYKESALSEDHGGSHGPAAGERAPDTTLLPPSNDRQPVRVFDLLRGTHWTLLLFAGSWMSPAGAEPLARLGQRLMGQSSLPLKAYVLLKEAPPSGTDWLTLVALDADNSAHEKYGVAHSGCMYLLRPDGYVGFRAPLQKTECLCSYLRQIEPQRVEPLV